MLYSSKTIALLLSLFTSFIVSLLLSLTKISKDILILTGIIILLVVFISTYMILELFIFSPINKIHFKLNGFNLDKKLITNSNFFHTLNRQIANYIKKKEREINELKELEIHRKELIADISHELKTPIFAAQSYIYTLIDSDMKDNEVNHKFLNKAASILDGLDSLVQDLLILSQMESGIVSMNMVFFDIHALIKEIIEQLENNAKEKTIRLLYDISTDKELRVYADMNKIKRVLINLIQNGIKYGKNNGWVKVKLIDLRKSVSVMIRDNGIGIPTEHIKHIFERFYRVEKSRSKKQGGTGLGLAIVKRILEGHSKKIKVKSKPEKETIFSFNLDKYPIDT